MLNQFSSPEGDLEKYFATEYWLIDQYVGDMLLSWGDNNYYQLGVNDNNTGRITPVETYTKGVDWKQVSCGIFNSLALKTNGTLYSWGDNTYGQLGLNTINDYRSVPTQINSDTDWRIVESGLLHSVALKSNGTLWSWGSNSYGQLGITTPNDSLVPIQVGSDTKWKVISARGFHTVAIKTDGTIWSWGRNNRGQLGLGDTNDRFSPTQIGTDSDWKFVSSNQIHTVALKNNGTLYSWGMNKDPNISIIDGVLGLGSGINNIVSTPTQIGTDSDWKYVSCGGYHTAAIKTNGSLWTWGRNDSGQLGVNDIQTRNTPTQIYGANLFQWKTVSCGYLHVCALKLDGAMYFWGDNNYSQSGISAPETNSSFIIPTPINKFKNNWKQVSSGAYHSSAVTSGTNPLLYIS